MTKRKAFTAEFKREAVRLLETSKKQPSDLARELGLRRNQLYKWKDQLSQRGEKHIFFSLYVGYCKIAL